jgi:hypothetical protein
VTAFELVVSVASARTAGPGPFVTSAHLNSPLDAIMRISIEYCTV